MQTHRLSAAELQALLSSDQFRLPLRQEVRVQNEEAGEATMITIEHFLCIDAVRASWKATVMLSRAKRNHMTAYKTKKTSSDTLDLEFENLFLLNPSSLNTWVFP